MRERSEGGAATRRPFPDNAADEFRFVMTKVDEGCAELPEVFRVTDETCPTLSKALDLSLGIPWYHTLSHLEKELAPVERGGHGVGADIMAALPGLLADPVAVLGPIPEYPTRYHIVLSALNSKRSPLVAVVDTRGTADTQDDRVRCAFLVTVTNRTSLSSMVCHHIEEGTVRYMRAERLNKLLFSAGLWTVEQAADVEPNPAPRATAPRGPLCLDACGKEIAPGAILEGPDGTCVRADFVGVGSFAYKSSLRLPPALCSLALDPIPAGQLLVEKRPAKWRIRQDPWEALADDICSSGDVTDADVAQLVRRTVSSARSLVEAELSAALATRALEVVGAPVF